MSLEEDYNFAAEQAELLQPEHRRGPGRPRKIDNTEQINTAKRMKADGKTAQDISKYLGISRATLYRYLGEGHASPASATTPVDVPAEEFDAEPAAESSEGGAGPLWRADFEGDEGTIQTGAMPDGFDPHNFDEVLSRLGYAPDEIKMELTASTRWEQRSALRKWSDKYEAYIRTGEYETVFLNAYRYRAFKNALNVHLPALYAEIAQGPLENSMGPQGDATAVVCWGDVQTGKVDELGGVKELLQRLESKREALDDYLGQADINHVIIADVGDILEGFENTGQQSFTNGLSLMDQVEVAATEFWKAIRICERHGPVDVLSIPSNHCQWRRKKNQLGKPTDDWGIHISKILEHRNEDAKLDVTFHRPDDWSEMLEIDVRNTKLGLAHGHQASNPDKVKDWWAKMTHGGILDCDVLLTGHFHFPSLRPSGKNHRTGQSRWHVQCSTLDNGSAWVRNSRGEDGDPALTVFQINDNGFDTGSFRLL